MTINKYLQQISPEDLAYVKRYHHEIQPFRVLPSSTLKFDGTLFSGRALYPLRVKERIASIFLASVSHFMWSTPAVRLPLLDVTFLTANALASNEVTRRCCKAFTLLYLFPV